MMYEKRKNCDGRRGGIFELKKDIKMGKKKQLKPKRCMWLKNSWLITMIFKFLYSNMLLSLRQCQCIKGFSMLLWLLG